MITTDMSHRKRRLITVHTYRCGMCRLTFDGLQSFVEHSTALHEGRLRYKGFSLERDRQKRYKCVFCDFKDSQAVEVVRHINQHYDGAVATVRVDSAIREQPQQQREGRQQYLHKAPIAAWSSAEDHIDLVCEAPPPSKKEASSVSVNGHGSRGAVPAQQAVSIGGSGEHRRQATGAPSNSRRMSRSRVETSGVRGGVDVDEDVEADVDVDEDVAVDVAMDVHTDVQDAHTAGERALERARRRYRPSVVAKRHGSGAGVEAGESEHRRVGLPSPDAVNMDRGSLLASDSYAWPHKDHTWSGHSDRSFNKWDKGHDQSLERLPVAQPPERTIKAGQDTGAFPNALYNARGDEGCSAFDCLHTGSPHCPFCAKDGTPDARRGRAKYGTHEFTEMDAQLNLDQPMRETTSTELLQSTATSFALLRARKGLHRFARALDRDSAEFASVEQSTAVAASLERKEHLLVVLPSNSGKCLAYLLPALLEGPKYTTIVVMPFLNAAQGTIRLGQEVGLRVALWERLKGYYFPDQAAREETTGVPPCPKADAHDGSWRADVSCSPLSLATSSGGTRPAPVSTICPTSPKSDLLHAQLVFVGEWDLPLPAFGDFCELLVRTGRLRRMVVTNCQVFSNYPRLSFVDAVHELSRSLNIPLVLLSSFLPVHFESRISVLYGLGSSMRMSVTRTSTVRKELSYNVKFAANEHEMDTYIEKQVRGFLTIAENEQRMIIYVRKSQEGVTLVERLNKSPFIRGKVGIFRLEKKPEQQKVTERWQRGKFVVMVATSEFSYGLDYPSVKRIIHRGAVDSLIGYALECSRAGRDGRKGICTLVTCDSYIARLDPLDRAAQAVRRWILNTSSCRRYRLHLYLDGNTNSTCFAHHSWHACDVCARLLATHKNLGRVHDF